MKNLYHILIEKLTGVSRKVEVENELEPTYEQYIARTRTTGPAIISATKTRKCKSATPQIAESARLVVPNRVVKGQVVDTVLFNLTNGEYGVLDILEDDAAALILA